MTPDFEHATARTARERQRNVSVMTRRDVITSRNQCQRYDQTWGRRGHNGVADKDKTLAKF